jgi:ketosteroid isomerase-like protein
MTNSEIVSRIYDAFGRGDVPAILARLAPDVEWEYGEASTDVPWLRPRRGRDAVPGFFEALASELAISRFAVTRLLSDDDCVVALVDLDASVRTTGRAIREVDEVHIWFLRDGLVTRFRHRADTHQHWRALHG